MNTDTNDIFYCRYCNRVLENLSPYSREKGIPMCIFCEVKHKEFEAIKKKKRSNHLFSISTP